jgi:hypothetical protein
LIPNSLVPDESAEDNENRIISLAIREEMAEEL